MENAEIQQKSLQKLRNNAEEDRKKRIKIIVTHRELLLKELFTMTGEGKLDESDHVISFLQGGDVTQVDQDKWGAFLDKHKISNVKLRQDSSASPSPTLDGSDPSKKLFRRMPPPLARMVTRGVSGAVRPKSVDEILSSLDQKDLIMSGSSPSPKSASPTHRSNDSKSNRPAPPRIITTVNSTRPLIDSKSANMTTPVYNGVELTTNTPNKNTKNENHVDLYAWKLRATHFPLYKQLQTARKTLTTHDWMLARDELKSVKTIQKIEALKKKNLWSLRQLKRHKSTPRAKTHWDSMLDEMKWMQTDFKEERKWKIAMAFMVSRAVMEWHRAEDKSTVCVKARIPEPKSLSTTPMMIEDQATQSTIPVSSQEEMEVDPIISSELTSEPQLLVESTIQESTSDDPLKTDAMMGAADTVDPILKIEPDNNNTDLAAMDTADESSLPTTPNFTAASLSTDIIQEYRSIIKDFDPNMPILTLSIEDFGEFDASALFPDMLTYAPPDPQCNDIYFNESEYGKITPITKLVSQHITLKTPQRYSRKRDVDGNPIIYHDETKDYKSDIKTLPRHERYDTTPLISPLFAPKRLKDSPAQQPSTPQAPTNVQTAVNHWSEDDDVCLISFIIQYSFNWDLICDALNSVRLPITGVKRSPWECHDRWKRNNLTSLSGQVSSAYTSKLKRELNRRPATIRFDSPNKRQRQYNIFEAIKKTQKKREESEKQNTTPAAPPRPTIETHGTNSAGQRLPSAMEMSMHKAQRERQMAQAVLEQRQLSAAISLGSQTPSAVPRATAVPQQPAAAATQARPPMSVATSAAAVVAAQARAAATAQAAAIASTTSPVAQNAVRPPQQQQQPVATAGGLPLNRYPAAQLQLLRQQQMVLMAAAQQQAAQQQAAAAAANGGNGAQVRPPTPATIQRFANAIQASQQQQQQQAQQQQLQQLQLQHAQVQAQQQAQLLAAQQLVQQQQTQQQQQQQAQAQQPTHTPAPSAETVAQQVSQMASPAVVQQSPQQRLPQQASPQQQQQLAAQLQAAQQNPLMFAAQLAQMGYPISQLPANQQLQLQRYLAQLQMRNAAVAAAAAANNGGAATQNNNVNNLQAALLAQQQLQRLQQVQQAQQALQMQQQQQAQQAQAQAQAQQQQQQQQQQPPPQ